MCETNDMVYKTQGIIIKKTDLAEADRLLTVYTKDFGKILVKAKAVKKSQAKLKGHLELFLYSHLMLAQGKSVDIITSAEIIDSFPALHHNLFSLAAAYYLSELVDKLVAEPEKDERIWELLLSGFQRLDKSAAKSGAAPDFEASNFERKLLEFLGYDLASEPDKQDSLSFIHSLIGERINSETFLKKTAFMLR